MCNIVVIFVKGNERITVIQIKAIDFQFFKEFSLNLNHV